MGFINLDRRSLIAKHELLEGQETHIPRVTLLISYVMTNSAWGLKHGSNLELPNATIDVTESVEWAPILEVLGLISRHGHLSNVVNHIFVIDAIVQKFTLVVSVK